MNSSSVFFLMAAILPILGFFHEPSTIIKTAPILLENDAYFGYSMAYDEKKLLIGAPAANKFGEIFEFNLAENTSVIEISSPLKKENNSEYDWFGATIKSYGSGSFLICAPRKIRPGHRLNRITRGRCYIRSSQSKEWVELADISDATRGFFNDGMDTYGWTVDVDENRDIWIASPVIQNSSIKIYDDPKNLKYNTRTLPTFRLNNGSDLISFGYSIVSGNFLSETGSDHAVSYTYGDNRHGKVFIFEKRMKKLEISGDKDSVGSMYGAVLCKANLGHKRASLLVGAPTFATPQGGYDRGAVYLYIPEDSSTNFALKRLIKGEKDAGYFGQAVISLGDMDGDQKDEVAIGAPFEEGGKGAVYIYSGAGLLSDRPWTQRIQRGAHSFGFSLLPLHNYSGNGLNGLSVGAPFENRVYVITPVPSITVNVDAILPNSQAGRKDPNYVDFTLVVDVTYPVLPKDIIGKLQVKLEIEHPDATLEHATNNGTVKLYNLSLNTTVTSYKETPRILTPIDGKYEVPISYTISVKLLDESEKEGQLNEGRVLLCERSNLLKRGVLWVSECKADEYCVPDLSAELRTSINEPYTVGSSDKEYLTLVVHNAGETAYNPCVAVNVQTVRVLRLPHGCALDPAGLVCAPTHPLRHNEDWEIPNIELEMDSLTSKLHDNIKSINILYDIYNDCNNKSGHKVSYNRSFALHYETGIHLMGISIPSEPVEITSSDLHNVTRLQHHYTIMNNGVVNWEGVTCDILLQKKNYLRYPGEVMMRRGPNMIPCPFEKGNMSKDKFAAGCNIGDLHKNDIIEVLIDVEVLPDFLRNALKSDDVTVSTQLTLRLLEAESISKNITSTLVLNKKSVPGWVIIIALLFGLLIILLIAFILYKYNCFERENKKKLEDLKTKRSIRRPNEIVEADGKYKPLQEEGENNVVGVPSVGHSVDQSVAPSVENSVDQCVAPSEDHSVDQNVASSEGHRIDLIVEAEIN